MNSSNLLTSPENYKPYLDERSRKDEILRSQIAERDSAEFTFQPKTNSSKILAARSKRLINAKREREKQIAKDKERQFFFASSADAGAKDENILDSQIPASGGDSRCSLKELGNVPNKGLDTEMEVIEKETKEEIKKDKKKVIEKNEVFAFKEDGKGVIEKDEMEGDERDGKEKYKIKEIEQDEMDEIGKDKNDGMEKYVIEEIEGDEEVEIEKLEEDDLERDRKDDIERDGKEEIEGDEKEGTEKDEIEEIGDDDKERIESDGTVEIEKDDGDFPLKKQESIAKNIVTVSVQTQTLSINESCTVVTSNEIIVEDNEVDAIICEDTEFEENNCHERLYRMGVDHHSRIAQIHEVRM